MIVRAGFASMLVVRVSALWAGERRTHLRAAGLKQ